MAGKTMTICENIFSNENEEQRKEDFNKLFIQVISQLLKKEWGQGVCKLVNNWCIIIETSLFYQIRFFRGDEANGK